MPIQLNLDPAFACSCDFKQQINYPRDDVSTATSVRQVWVTMSMPAGQAVVFIKNKQGRTVFLKVIENLSMLFPEENHIPIADSRDGGDVREDAVQFVIHGVVDGMQLANHYIHLKSRQIPGTEGGKGGGGGRGRKGKKGGGDEGNRGSLDDLSDMDMPKL